MVNQTYSHRMLMVADQRVLELRAERARLRRGEDAMRAERTVAAEPTAIATVIHRARVRAQRAARRGSASGGPRFAHGFGLHVGAARHH